MIGGVELRRERMLGEIVSDAFTIYFAYWRQMATIAIPAVLVSVAFSLLILAVTGDSSSGAFAETESDSLDIDGWVILITLISLPFQFVAYQLVSGGGVAFMDETDQGKTLAPAEALDAAQARLGTLLRAALRATVIAFLLTITIIGLPLAIWRLVRWIFLSQVIMVDGTQGEQVLAQSAALVQGRWWNTLGRLLVTGLIVTIPVGILGGAFEAAFPGVVGTILSASTGLISIPYGIIATTLMFFDLKIRKAREAEAAKDAAGR